jgi:colanic acid biosynthesis glycosyl transferase WcaI
MTATVQPLSDECEQTFDAAPGLAAAAATSPRKSVVVYAMNYAPETAGVGKYTGEIAEYLAAEGMDVTVVTTPPHYPGWSVQAGYRNRYSSAAEGRITVLRAPLMLRRKMRGIWRLLAPLSFALTSAPVVFWQILRHRPTTVFCVEPTLFAAPVAQLAAKLVGARTVLHVHDMEVDAAFAVGHLSSRVWLKTLGHVFERSVLGRFDRLITISNRMAEGLVLKGVPEARVSVVRNWVDLAHIHPMEDVSPYRAELGFGAKDFVVLYSGSIGAKQGLSVLLDAAERLKDEPRIYVVIAGEGPQKAELEDHYGHLANVRFLAFQPYARLNALLNMPDLHVLPQDRSTADLALPSKLGGMLASGKPVLVTADAGTELAQFVENAVYLTPPNDPENLAACILRAMSERDEWQPHSQTALVQNLSKRPAIIAIRQLIDGGEQ